MTVDVDVAYDPTSPDQHSDTVPPAPKYIVFNPWKLFRGLYVPEWLAERPEVSPGAKLCYGRLLRYAGRKGVAYPSVRTLGKALGVSERQVSRYLSELRKHGLIHVTVRRAHSALYEFLLHPWFVDLLPAELRVLVERIDDRPQGDESATTSAVNVTTYGDAYVTTPSAQGDENTGTFHGLTVLRESPLKNESLKESSLRSDSSQPDHGSVELEGVGGRSERSQRTKATVALVALPRLDYEESAARRAHEELVACASELSGQAEENSARATDTAPPSPTPSPARPTYSIPKLVPAPAAPSGGSVAGTGVVVDTDALAARLRASMQASAAATASGMKQSVATKAKNPKQQSAYAQFAEAWHAAFKIGAPEGTVFVRWGGKEVRQAKSLVAEDLTVAISAARYVWYAWPEIGKRLFKDRAPAVPTLGLLLAFKAQLMVEAQVFSQAMRTLTSLASSTRGRALNAAETSLRSKSLDQLKALQIDYETLTKRILPR